jgi:hypothetical protein
MRMETQNLLQIQKADDFHLKKTGTMAKKLQNKLTTGKAGSSKKKFPGYKLYPPQEDIYNREKEEKDIDPEDTSKLKTPNEDLDTLNEKDFEDDVSGDDLDVPGTELDDTMEDIGSEDEENNYYSLGGDNHF